VSLILSFDGPRADVLLDRPEVLNAMDFDVFDSLARAADEIAEHDPRVVVISGKGRSFSAGIDVGSLGSVSGGPETIARAQAPFRKIAALPMPTIALVRGHALGAGLQLALACDLRVVTPDATLGLLEANYGLIPDLGGSTRLPQIVGTARAKRMIWLAEKFTGAEASDLGVADLVASEDDIEAVVSALAERLAEAPFSPTRAAKRLIDGAPFLALEDGMDAEASAQEGCMTAPDFAENMMRGIQRLRTRS
jgi:enoyl-CoA hydratase/carnithine racemase